MLCWPQLLGRPGFAAKGRTARVGQWRSRPHPRPGRGPLYAPARAIGGSEDAPADAAAKQKEHSSLSSAIEGTEQGTAAGATDEDAAALSQLTIPAEQEELAVEITLCATRPSLDQASLKWVSEVTVEGVPDTLDVASFAAWLERTPAELNLTLNSKSSAEAPQWVCSTLTALPAHLISSLTLENCELQDAPPALSALTQLTSLDLSNTGISSTASLASLHRLQRLNLQLCCLAEVPEQVSALTALTCLDLGYNFQVNGGWQHLTPLAQLQDLDLGHCELTALPEQLSTLTALTCLDLACNWRLHHGWQHLLPLTQLRYLILLGVLLPLKAAPVLVALPQLRVV